MWKLGRYYVFPPVDADAGINPTEGGGAKVSTEKDEEKSDDTDSGTDVESKKKPKKEKIGFRDRKVKNV